MWIHHVALAHGPSLRDERGRYDVQLRALHKGVRMRYDELAATCDANLYALAFLRDRLLSEPRAEAAEGVPDDGSARRGAAHSHKRRKAAEGGVT